MPELCVASALCDSRGRRESRVPIAPMAPRATKSTGVETTGSTGNTPAFPAQWFTAYSALSPVTGLFCHRRLSRELLRAKNLAPASGRQDHTTSPSASATLVSRDISVHRISTRVRDDRDPPLFNRVRRAELISDLPDGESGIFFVRGLDRLLTDLPVVPFCRTRASSKHRHSPMRRKAQARHPYLPACARSPVDSGLALRALGMRTDRDLALTPAASIPSDPSPL
jgi:hypothetical protein